jgi:hypothetical protein
MRVRNVSDHFFGFFLSPLFVYLLVFESLLAWVRFRVHAFSGWVGGSDRRQGWMDGSGEFSS